MTAAEPKTRSDETEEKAHLSDLEIQGVFMQASCVRLNTSYRSSWEITRFA